VLLIELLGDVQEPSFESPEYAALLWYVPKMGFLKEGGIKVHPILSMLNLRYIIFRGSPRPFNQPLLRQEDYWVMENRDALPRVYVPRGVEVVDETATTLSRLAAADFDPRRIAFVAEAVYLPSDCRGSVTIVDEVPSQVTVAADMETPGLLVLADLWDEGWSAEVNGSSARILRANHALRGVVLPAGASTVVFRYEPRSLLLGTRLLAAALGVCVLWLTVLLWAAYHRRTGPPNPEQPLPMP
jgi:hypothetical protein